MKRDYYQLIPDLLELLDEYSTEAAEQERQAMGCMIPNDEEDAECAVADIVEAIREFNPLYTFNDTIEI
jgi:hypothetical protein